MDVIIHYYSPNTRTTPARSQSLTKCTLSFLIQRYTLEMNKIRVYYDAACPICQRDRRRYERFRQTIPIEWCDINTQAELLKAKQIDPQKALLELHIETPDGTVTSNINAYVILLNNIPLLRPIAWLLNLNTIKNFTQHHYRKSVDKRLRQQGRFPT